MQRLQRLPLPLRMLAYVVVAAVVLSVAVVVGVLAALTLGPDEGQPEGANPERAGKANPAGGGRPEDGEAGGYNGLSKAAYLSKIAEIQNRSVEAALKSHEMLMRYDGLTAGDVEEMQANYAVLRASSDKVKGLDPPQKYSDQFEVFALAIDELRDANGLAYHLAADPTSATQADFEAYDRHIERATANLQRSNEMLGQDYKTIQTAQETSLG